MKFHLTILIAAALQSNVFPFSPSRCFTSQPSSHLIFMAKPKSKSKNSGGGGGGFSSGSSSSGAKEKNNGKVRSVSGYQGSGTKPLRVAANTFDELRKKYGVACCSDLYVRSPLNDKDLFWFVGKVARCSEEKDLTGSSIPTEQEAVISQKRLILEYAKRELRPQNMGGPFSEGLEIWLAPGDSEMDSVQNKISFTKVEGSVSSLSDGFQVSDVGYNPEIYVGEEIRDGGLRVVRDENGDPVKDTFEINAPL
eukprot:CAMPEP_0194212358 /NCGR_PEP_ID=MMETSP0156-20130528/12144_1 /TAXON_ID=33649 /ORGANISM="Thalassionema nitzschioides, Strain L26-B" /LENGTH=251 /DNA_ID=CAMNT_0038940157 /DNA_START=9 /DNA_END=764 /DNA_ORIENTATION=+